MQDYTYSVFSMSALALHLIFNWNIVFGRKLEGALGGYYRFFLIGVLAYYVSDAAWGIFAGLGWVAPWYADTIFFFLSLVAFIFLWGRFVATYLGFGKWPKRFLDWLGYAILAFNVAAIAANPFTHCFFYFDAGVYKTGFLRDPAFILLIAFNMVAALAALANAVRTKNAIRRRSAMVFLCGLVVSSAMTMQIVWPLTPFTSLGCMLGCVFLHVFVLQDEQATGHALELETALERARAADKARSMFFSIVSHDIRTPLNAILGYSELLQKGTESESERKDALKFIRDSGKTLLLLVDDVLNLAKMDAGMLALHLEPVILAQLTDEVYSSFWRDASEKGVELVNSAGAVPTLMIDGHRFRQILFNLIGNAVKFTKSGHVEVKASYSDGILVVSVSDTGCGIPADMLLHILDPFVQIIDPSHVRDRAAGTGLGLSICRRLAEAMGGELDVKSELGRGSTFIVRVPAEAAKASGMPEEAETAETEERKAGDAVLPAAGAPPPATGPRPAAGGARLPLHVLVVDDSPINRKVITAFLKKAGVVRVDHAGDGAEALAALDAAVKAGDPHDYVFSDFWMPVMNGLELVEKLRADPRFAGLPVYAVTADTECRKDPRSALFDDILLKPVTYGRLSKALGRQP